MLSEYLVGLFIIAFVFYNVSQVTIRNPISKTNDASIFLLIKFEAINSYAKKEIDIKNKVINDRFSSSLQDCSVSWASSGNASKAGTCFYDDLSKISIKVGGGGIGYPW